MGHGIESQRRFFRGVFREIARIQLGLDEGVVAQRANDEAHARLLRLVERGQARGDLNDALDAGARRAAFRSLANGTITGWLYQDEVGSLVDLMRAAADVFLSSVERTERAASSKGARDDPDDDHLRPVRPRGAGRPVPVYARLRRDAPVHYVESLDAFAVSRHADVRRVMHDHRTFSSEAMAALVARPVEYSVAAHRGRAALDEGGASRSSEPTATRTRACARS